MQKYITKFLDWVIKLASVVVTAPATWMVASNLFSDINAPTLLFLIRLGAVLLVEGVLLSNWLLLEFDKQAVPEIKARYGLTALAMYIAMLIIAWAHEGPVGLVFRFALLAALVGSGWDTYVYTWRKVVAQADRDPLHSPAVRKHARKLTEENEKLRLSIDANLYREREQSREAVEIKNNELREKINTQRSQLLYDQLQDFLDEGFEDVIERALDQVSQNTLIFTPYRHLAEENAGTKIIVMSAEPSQPIVQSSVHPIVEDGGSSDDVPELSAITIDSRWAETYSKLPVEFSRVDVQGACGCKKSWAAKLLSHGREVGDIVPVGRGKYRKAHPEKDTPVEEMPVESLAQAIVDGSDQTITSEEAKVVADMIAEKEPEADNHPSDGF